jgi:hypothetical protein
VSIRPAAGAKSAPEKTVGLKMTLEPMVVQKTQDLDIWT